MTWWYLRWAGLAAVRAARRWEGLASVRATCLHYIVSIIFSSLYCVRATCLHLRLLFLVFLEEDKKSWKRESCDCKRENDPQKSRVGVLDCGGEKFSIGLEVFFGSGQQLKSKQYLLLCTWFYRPILFFILLQNMQRKMMINCSRVLFCGYSRGR